LAAVHFRDSGGLGRCQLRAGAISVGQCSCKCCHIGGSLQSLLRHAPTGCFDSECDRHDEDRCAEGDKDRNAASFPEKQLFLPIDPGRFLFRHSFLYVPRSFRKLRQMSFGFDINHIMSLNTTGHMAGIRNGCSATWPVSGGVRLGESCRNKKRNQPMLILQIGDKPFRCEPDFVELEGRGFRRERVNSLDDAIPFIELYDFDVILADLDISGGSRFDTIREIRAVSNVPIIGITTSVDPRVKIGALDLGADDVLTQLCSLDETLARVRAVVRRWQGHVDSKLRCGRLELNLVAHEVRVDGIPLRLGPKEYLLLEFLILKRGAAVSKTACMTHLYGTDEYPEAKTIDVVLCRLRKRLAPQGMADMIESVWGYGFRLKDTDADGPVSRMPAPVRRAALAPA
jgi:two-component system cell cycle response regulator CtrA